MLLYLLSVISSAFFTLLIVTVTEACNIDKTSRSRIYSALVLAAVIGVSDVFCVLHSYSNIPIVSYIICMVCCSFILYRKISLSYIYISVIADFFVTSCSTGLLEMIGHTDDMIYRISTLLIIRFVLLLMALAAKKKQNNVYTGSVLLFIPKYIYILIAADMFLMSSVSYVNNYQLAEYAKKQYVINILMLLLTVITLAIILSLFVNAIMLRHSKDIVKLLDSHIDLQISHYKKLDELDSEMRRFRHDYINHLHSILSLIKMQEYADAEKYTEGLLRIEDAPVIIFNTGNHLADAIISEKAEKFKENGLIEFSGIIPPELDNVDLCTILSNALDNAVEACRSCGGDRIVISAGPKCGYFVMTVTNPADKTVCFDGITPTAKNDTKNHGFGLASIGQAVRKHDGKMEIHCTDGVCELSVILKI